MSSTKKSDVWSRHRPATKDKAQKQKPFRDGKERDSTTTTDIPLTKDDKTPAWTHPREVDSEEEEDMGDPAVVLDQLPIPENTDMLWVGACLG